MDVSHEMLAEVWISAVKIGVPAAEVHIRPVIATINTLLADDFPVMLAPYDYDAFVDEDEGYFDHSQFAEALSDLWTTLQTLCRNGDNDKIRSLIAFVDQFVLGVDTVNSIMEFDF